MAGGLGTRMRSALPKHLHPLLGRRHGRLGDRAPRASSAPTRSSSSPRPRRGDAFDGAASRSPSRSEPLGTGDAVRAARAALEGLDERRARPVRRHARCSPPELLRGARRRRTAASGAAATVLTFEPAGRRAVRPRRPRRRRPTSRAIVEAADATPEELAIDEVNSSIYVFRAERLWPALERLEPHERPGRALPHRRGRASSSRTARRVAAHVAADPLEAEGVNTRVELAAAAAVAPRPDQRAAHARRRDDRRSRRRPGSSRTSSSSPTSTIHPFTVLRGRTRVARRRRDRPARGRDRRRDRAAARRSARSVTFAPARSSRRERRRGRSSRSRTRASASGTKVPHLSYIGDAEIGEDTNIGAGNDHRELPARARQAEGPDDDRQERQDRDPQWLRCPGRGRRRSMDCSGIGHHRGRPARTRSRSRAPRQVNKEGYAARQRRRLSCAPAARASRSRRATVTEPKPGHWIERGPQKRLMVFSGRSHPELAQRIADAARHPARRGRRSRRSRTARRTAATTSRSAAPTSSSSRPAASPIDQQPDGAAAA